MGLNVLALSMLSSTNLEILLIVHVSRSFLQMKNVNGRRTDPRRIPLLTGAHGELSQLILFERQLFYLVQNPDADSNSSPFGAESRAGDLIECFLEVIGEISMALEPS